MDNEFGQVLVTLAVVGVVVTLLSVEIVGKVFKCLHFIGIGRVLVGPCRSDI